MKDTHTNIHITYTTHHAYHIHTHHIQTHTSYVPHTHTLHTNMHTSYITYAHITHKYRYHTYHTNTKGGGGTRKNQRQGNKNIIFKK